MTPRNFLLILAFGLGMNGAFAQPGPIDFAQFESYDGQKIQVVFALDVTGSMSGLLATAKDKIWTIASSLAQGEGQVEISMGIVAYRDRGDAFVTKITDLTDDLDYAYSQLMALKASGGGDAPESVNQALDDAVNRITWDSAPATMRTIFLVGDCPPHMDYKGEKKYPEICAEAAQKDITINSMLMGENTLARNHWEQIALAASGDFFEVGMNANNLAVATPYDEAIKEKSKELERSMIYYGTEEDIKKAEADKEIAIDLAESLDAGAVSRRAAFNSTAAGHSNQFESNELINRIASEEITLDDLSEDELPQELRVLDEEERAITVQNYVQQRIAIQSELDELIGKRDAHIETTVTASEAESSFSGKVWGSLKKQGKKKNIALSDKVKF